MLLCPQESSTDSKLMTISAAVSVRLQTDCSCSVAVRNPVFSCANTADSKTVVFLAELQYSAPAEVDVPSLFTSWVSSGPVITVNSIQLQVNTTGPVVTDSMQGQSYSVAPPTAVIAVAVCVSILVVVIITAVIVTALVVFCRKRSRYMTRCAYTYILYQYQHIYTTAHNYVYTYIRMYVHTYVLQF